MKLPTRIPTIIGLLLVIGVVGGVALSFESVSRLPILASESTKPASIAITNRSDTSFTFTWTTASPASGALIVSYPKGQQTVFDERDNSGKLNKYLTHSVTVRNLTGDTAYAVKILSNGKTYLDNSAPYNIRTAPALTDSPAELTPAYGSSVTSDNQPANGALVFLTLEGSQTLSTLVKSSGTWLIPLNLLRTEGGESYFSPPSDRVTETILIRSDGQQSQAVTDTLNDSPVPVMVLDKDYDFRKQQAKLPDTLAQAAVSTPQPTSTPAVLGVQSPQSQFHVTLVAPAEGAALTSQLPLIQGTGIPNKSVTVTLGITKPTSATTAVGADGIFRYTPKKQLAPGKQSVTIMTMDNQNTPVAITHSFEILKSGTQVLGDATPSATLAPLFTPTPTSTLAGEPIPTSATTFPTILLLIAGLVLFSGGMIAFVVL